MGTRWEPGKRECYKFGATGHFSREYPHPNTGKSLGKGFQGEWFNCGEMGHPARECPKNKGAWSKGGDKGREETKKGQRYLAGRWRRCPERFCLEPAGGGEPSEQGGERRVSGRVPSCQKESFRGHFLPEIFAVDRLSDRRVNKLSDLLGTNRLTDQGIRHLSFVVCLHYVVLRIVL